MFSFDFNWADYAIIGVIVVSCLISIIRGFVREALSLLVWAGAVWLALSFSGDIADIFKEEIKNPLVRLGIGFVLIFFSTLVVGAILSVLITMLVDKTGLTGTDRVLGMVFGAIRGVLVISVLLLLVKFSSMPQDTWWKESKLIVQFEPLELWLQDFMQDQIKTYMPENGTFVGHSIPLSKDEIAIPPISKKKFEGILPKEEDETTDDIKKIVEPTSDKNQ